MFTVQNVIDQSNKMSSDPNLLTLAIDFKSEIQKEVADSFADNPASKFMSINNIVIREGKLRLAKIQKTETNIFCIALAVGTILKELHEDTSYVSNQAIANYMNQLVS